MLNTTTTHGRVGADLCKKYEMNEKNVLSVKEKKYNSELWCGDIEKQCPTFLNQLKHGKQHKV